MDPPNVALVDVSNETPRQRAIRAVAASVFADPSRLRATLTHRVVERFDIAPHRHDDVLQFDLLVGCGGRAKVDDTWHELSGVTTLLAPPGSEHGYRLEPEAGEEGGKGVEAGRVYHVRLAVEGLAEWLLPGPGVGGLPRIVTGQRANEALASAMRVVVRLGAVEAARPPLLLARLAEALCLWPTAEDAAEPMGDTVGDGSPEGALRGLEAAVEMLESRMSDPPPLDELAQVAHFSVRHFTRRFQQAFGCTPHAYATARRYAEARQLLSQERLQVGQIAEHLGFTSVATFSRWFSQQAGQSPTAWRKDPQIM